MCVRMFECMYRGESACHSVPVGTAKKGQFETNKQTNKQAVCNTQMLGLTVLCAFVGCGIHPFRLSDVCVLVLFAAGQLVFTAYFWFSMLNLT